MQKSDRYRGALLGLATGDALGTTLEFTQPGSFDPLTEMMGGGPFRLKPGEWTDDTSMALCLAASLVEQGRFDAEDQMERYLRWRDSGYMSSNGRCFDIGGTVSKALRAYERSGDPYSGPTDYYSAGNGSLMRLAPVPLFFANDPKRAIALSATSSRTTHGAREAVDACRYFASLLMGVLAEHDKATLLSPSYALPDGIWKEASLAPKIEAIRAGSFKRRNPPDIRGTGYVVNCLEAALWAFYRTDTFREGCLKAVNLGEDADTTGAVYGQLAGAYYGARAIPECWRNTLALRERIVSLADGLLAQSGMA